MATVEDVVAPEVLAAIEAAKNAPAPVTGNSRMLEEAKKAEEAKQQQGVE
jgi:hypothetical protein